MLRGVIAAVIGEIVWPIKCCRVESAIARLGDDAVCHNVVAQALQTQGVAGRNSLGVGGRESVLKVVVTAVLATFRGSGSAQRSPWTIHRVDIGNGKLKIDPQLGKSVIVDAWRAP